MPADIRIHAIRDGAHHPLDTRDRMLSWFARPAGPADYFVSHAGTVYEFDGCEWNAPRSPSHLVTLALSRIPGNAPRGPRGDWSLLDDFTRGQCVLLARALRERIGGELVVCGLDHGSECGEEDLPCDTQPPFLDIPDWRHAGVLLDGSVYCAMGRSDPALWAYEIVRSESCSVVGRITEETLARLLPPTPRQAVLDAIPAVVDLISMLVSEHEEPRRPTLRLPA